jgi:hypothetical protein
MPLKILTSVVHDFEDASGLPRLIRVEGADVIGLQREAFREKMSVSGPRS